MQEKRAQQLLSSIKLPMNCLNGAIGSVLLYPSRLPFRKADGPVPIVKRSWAYQEHLLSRRVVSFFNDAMEWTCSSCYLSDDRLGEDELGATDPAYLKATISLSQRSIHLSRLLHAYSAQKYGSPKELANLSWIWWAAVSEYTLGSLSNRDDRLPAFAGIASEFHDVTGDIYVAGLWMSHLRRDLQWRGWKSLEESSNNTGNKDFEHDAPTWTWASVHECEILGPDRTYDHDSDRVEIIECKVNLVSPSAPFGSVNGGEVRLCAPLKFLSYRRIQEMLALVDGDGEFIGRIFLDRRSRYHADELTTLRGGAAPHIESTGVWFLGLSKHTDLTYESRGLILAKRADGLFERIGVFQIYVSDDWLECGTADLDELRSSWGDDYVVTDVTIV